ncbi:putative metal cation-transporting P-type ATPase C ctpC [Mycobacterium xenopi 3993]|nr:putative metal cation-transporting P-type ATPase C ctpC [Mycobacterium xenopi 3993]
MGAFQPAPRGRGRRGSGPQDGVRVVHAYPRTGSVVVWYSPKRCDRSAVLAAIKEAAHTAAELIPARAPHSSEIRNADVLRMVIGGAALALLGVRRYVFARPPLLGPTGRLAATGVTIFTGIRFCAARCARSGPVAPEPMLWCPPRRWPAWCYGRTSSR